MPLEISTKMTVVHEVTELREISNLSIVDVKSLQVIGGLPGFPGSALYLNMESAGKAVISKIMNWIHVSKPIISQTVHWKRGYPETLDIIMNDGKLWNIEPGYHCILHTNEDGSGTKTCTPDKGEILLSINSNTFRLATPELYDWLTEGWKQE